MQTHQLTAVRMSDLVLSLVHDRLISSAMYTELQSGCKCDTISNTFSLSWSWQILQLPQSAHLRFPMIEQSEKTYIHWNLREMGQQNSHVALNRHKPKGPPLYLNTATPPASEVFAEAGARATDTANGTTDRKEAEMPPAVQECAGATLDQDILNLANRKAYW